MLLQVGEVYNPSTQDVVLMFLAGIVFFVILFWRRLAPGSWRSRFVSNKVQKAWHLMSTEDQKVAYTRLMVEAAKSDGKVTGEEGEAIFEEMDASYKRAAAQLSPEEMYASLNTCEAEVKAHVLEALHELLNADGEFAPAEATWLAEVVKRLS